MSRYAFLVIILLSASISTYANTDGNCAARIKIMEFSKIEMQDCKLAAALVNNPEIREYQKNKIYEKLSKKLAQQVEQNMEEMALLDQFFSFNDKDLLLDKNVEKNCKLTHVKNIEKSCGGKKLSLLKKDFGIAGASFAEQLANKYASVRNIGEKSRQRSCPLHGSSGDFTLASQIDTKSAFLLIQATRKESGEKDTKPFYDEYPQFKLIEKGDARLKNKFKEYLMKFAGSPLEAKKYVTDFLINEDNKGSIALGLAQQCKKITSNLETFLCSDLDQIGSLEKEASEGLFNLTPKMSLEDMFDVPHVGTEVGDTFMTAYGFQCLAQSQAKKPNPSENIDDWYKNFTANIRKAKTSNETSDASGNFCNLYNCQGAINLCKSGNHLKSDDMAAYYNCPFGDKCTKDISKYFTYLQVLEKETSKKQSLNEIAGNSSQKENQVNGKVPVEHYSRFTENLLGVEGTLLTEGKKITPASIAERSLEFAEKKLDTTMPVRDIKIAEKSTQPQQETIRTVGEQPMQAATSLAPTMGTSKFEQYASNENFSDSAAKIPAKSSKDSALNKRDTNSTYSPSFGGNSAAENERDTEMKKIRSELEAVTKSLKGSEAEKLAAVTDSNAKYTAPALAGNKSDTSGLNAAERDRLEAYQRSLNAWENRLKNWQTEIATNSVNHDNRSPAANDANAAGKKTDNYSGDSAGRGSHNDSGLTLSSGEKDKSKSSKGPTANVNALSAEAPEALISSEELADMKVDSLKKIGINFKSSFIMKIRHQNKIYDVAVKSFAYKGKDILVPLLNDQNSTLAKIVLESPLFSDYKSFQNERVKERQAYAKAVE
jgi:hypothetical protein